MNRLQRSLLFIAALLCLSPIVLAAPNTYDVSGGLPSTVEFIKKEHTTCDDPVLPKSVALQPRLRQKISHPNHRRPRQNIRHSYHRRPRQHIRHTNGHRVIAEAMGECKSSGVSSRDEGGTDAARRTPSSDESLYESALSAPDEVSTSGSSFAYRTFSDPYVTLPVLASNTTDNFTFKVHVNLNNNDYAVTIRSADMNVVPLEYSDYMMMRLDFGDAVSSVPEPGEYMMLLLGFGMVGYRIKRKQANRVCRSDFQ